MTLSINECKHDKGFERRILYADIEWYDEEGSFIEGDTEGVVAIDFYCSVCDIFLEKKTLEEGNHLKEDKLTELRYEYIKPKFLHIRR